MLKIECPYCHNSLNLKQPRPGDFRPKCSKCQQVFALKIGDDLSKSVVGRISTEPSSGDKLMSGEPGSGSQQSAKAASARAIAAVQKHAADETQNDPLAAETKGATSATRFVPNPEADATSAEFAAASPPSAPIAERLGGYRLLKELGRGGLGVVYLAQQLSLNRQVAVKLIQTKLASSTTAISRFFREAYAAAQLVHHNVVQIYDLGQQNGTNFFSMEFVQGQNLAEVVKQHGPLEPRQAAGYILQAARGLQFAHHQGMVHRDVKPANLMLDQHGVVKVADLGLVKLPATADEPVDAISGDSASGTIQLTGLGATVGTVNYISPEQAANSSNVDHRADIYSLGCTFYTLLTGSPPFSGSSAKEVLAKHKSEPIKRPETVAPRVDKRLSDIVIRMVEKRPENRYADLGEVIADLQEYLGIAEGKSFAPTQKLVQELESSQKAYYGQSLAQARTLIPIGYFALGLLVAVIVSLMSWRWGLACLVALAMAPLAAVVMAGLRQQSRVFEKARELFLAGGMKNWLTLAFALILVLVVALGMLGPLLLTASLGIGLGLGYYFVVDQGLAKEREPALNAVRQLLRNERIAGIDEDDLRRFVATYSGGHWEEYFEDLFGYEALQRARADIAGGPAGPPRKRFRPWRDSLIRYLDQRLDAKRRERDAEKLRAIEQKSLVAAGMSPLQAAAEADRVAQSLVQEAAQWRLAAAKYQPGQAADPQAAALAKRARIKAMLAEAKSGAQSRPRSILSQLDKPLDLLLGAHVRLILGTVLVVGCVLWIRHNGIFSSITADSVKAAAQSIQAGNVDVGNLASQAGLSNAQPRQDLPFPLFGPWVSNFNAGIAGLLLVASVLFAGWRASLIALPLAAAIWLGPIWFSMPWLWK